MKYTLKNKEIELTDDEVKAIVKQNIKPVEEKKVGLEIKNRFTGSVLFTSTKTTWKEAVEEANLRGANLYGANLREADLRGADLSRADLQNAKFYGKGGKSKLTKEQLPDFLNALGFQVIE